MQNNSIPERITQLREHFGLSKKQFGQETGMSLTNVYRIEGGNIGLSDRFLRTLTMQYAVNPKWILTGEGEMFLAATDYINQGLELFGDKQMSEGFLKALADPRFAEFQSYILIDEVKQEYLSDALQELMLQVLQLWQQGDERTRKMLIQFIQAFPEIKK